MKIKGDELKQFMNEAWPGEDWYWDHELFDPDPDPDKMYDTNEISNIMYQGDGEDPTGGDGYDLNKLIVNWRRNKNHASFKVIVKKEDIAKFRELASWNGWKVY